MSWEQWAAIVEENKTLANIDAAEAPSACPVDGAILDVNANNTRNCPMGNYRWPQ